MPHIARIAHGGMIHHVLNRWVGEITLLRGRKDFRAFQIWLTATLQTTPMRILAFCVMRNHWHLVLWPVDGGDLAKFMMRLTMTYVRRRLIHRHRVWTGHVYQRRYPIVRYQRKRVVELTST